MEQLSIIEKVGANYILLEVLGNLNSYTYTELQNKIVANIKEQEVVVDLSAVKSISSSGLGSLMVGYEDGETYGHKLYIMNPSQIVKLAIDSTGFAEYFKIIHSVIEVV